MEDTNSADGNDGTDYLRFVEALSFVDGVHGVILRNSTETAILNLPALDDWGKNSTALPMPDGSLIFLQNGDIGFGPRNEVHSSSNDWPALARLSDGSFVRVWQAQLDINGPLPAYVH